MLRPVSFGAIYKLNAKQEEEFYEEAANNRDASYVTWVTGQDKSRKPADFFRAFQSNEGLVIVTRTGGHDDVDGYLKYNDSQKDTTSKNPYQTMSEYLQANAQRVEHPQYRPLPNTSLVLPQQK